MRVFIDACVLFPTVPREILLGCGQAGLIVPVWSARVLEEWRRAVLRAHPEQAGQVGTEIALARAGFPGAEVAADPALEARLTLPDADDRHVLAAAIAGRAALIVTRNLRDFPPRSLAAEGIAVQAPDPLLLGLWQEAPDAVAGIAGAAVAGVARHSGLGAREVLKRAGLPRLGKALARMG